MVEHWQENVTRMEKQFRNNQIRKLQDFGIELSDESLDALLDKAGGHTERAMNLYFDTEFITESQMENEESQMENEESQMENEESQEKQVVQNRTIQSMLENTTHNSNENILSLNLKHDLNTQEQTVESSLSLNENAKRKRTQYEDIDIMLYPVEDDRICLSTMILTGHATTIVHENISETKITLDAIGQHGKIVLRTSKGRKVILYHINSKRN